MDVVDPRDGPVAVERDGDQVENGRSTTEDVERRPGVAEADAEEPARADFVDGGQRHDERGDEQIGDGQRRDQVVGDVAQVSLEYDRRYHEHVTNNRSQDDGAKHY